MKKYEAMVLSCIDPRFQTKVYKYLKNKKLIGKYSSFTIAGAGIANLFIQGRKLEIAISYLN